MSVADVTIRPAQGEADLAAVRALLRAYWRELAFDPCFQGFADELAGLPGLYAPPEGALLLAKAPGGAALGCVAMRPLSPGFVEMKRLYVAREARGLGLGRALAEAICAEALRAGYLEMRLDTVLQLGTAQAMYLKMGFARIAPYYDAPEGLLFFGKRLAAQS